MSTRTPITPQRPLLRSVRLIKSNFGADAEVDDPTIPSRASSRQCAVSCPLTATGGRPRRKVHRRVSRGASAMRHSEPKRKPMSGVGHEDIGSAAGIPTLLPPAYRRLPRSKSREARPWLSADAPAIPRRQDRERQAAIRRFASFGCRQAFCRVHAVALRVVHGQLSVAPSPNPYLESSPLTTRGLCKIEHAQRKAPPLSGLGAQGVGRTGTSASSSAGKCSLPVALTSFSHPALRQGLVDAERLRGQLHAASAVSVFDGIEL
jgi:hypothetical protein